MAGDERARRFPTNTSPFSPFLGQTVYLNHDTSSASSRSNRFWSSVISSTPASRTTLSRCAFSLVYQIIMEDVKMMANLKDVSRRVGQRGRVG